jgi:hypothetical protein
MTKISQLSSSKASKAVLLNSDDWGYGYFKIDEPSLLVFEDNFSSIESDLNRCVILSQVFSMVHQGDYPAQRLLRFLEPLRTEKNYHILESFANVLSGDNRWSLNHYLPVES